MQQPSQLSCLPPFPFSSKHSNLHVCSRHSPTLNLRWLPSGCSSGFQTFFCSLQAFLSYKISCDPSIYTTDTSGAALAKARVGGPGIPASGPSSRPQGSEKYSLQINGLFDQVEHDIQDPPSSRLFPPASSPIPPITRAPQTPRQG